MGSSGKGLSANLGQLRVAAADVDPAQRGDMASGFVPTDSMSTALRWFAEYQPFTPFTETLRGLLLGTAVGNSAAASVAWCVVITVVSYLWARAAFNRDPGPTAA